MIDNNQFIIDRNIAFAKEASKQIYLHRKEFETYISDNSKLDAVKALKDYTGGSLKECLDTINLYRDGKLKLYIIEERRDKLKQLDKPIMIENIISIIKNTDDNQLIELFSNIPYDTIESISILFENSKNK
jgi:GTP-binding protein EngB required for normal cell division